MPRLLLMALLFQLSASLLFAQDYPAKPDSIAVVNDFAELFSAKEKEKLSKLGKKHFTKNGIRTVVVVLESVNEAEPDVLFDALGDAWDIAKFEKSIYMLIIPKTKDHKGEVLSIANFGMEDNYAMDDKSKDIVDFKMIPHFKKRNMYKGTKAGISAFARLILASEN